MNQINFQQNGKHVLWKILCTIALQLCQMAERIRVRFEGSIIMESDELMWNSNTSLHGQFEIQKRLSATDFKINDVHS